MGQFNGDLLKIGNWQQHFMEESLDQLYIFTPTVVMKEENKWNLIPSWNGNLLLLTAFGTLAFPTA